MNWRKKGRIYVPDGRIAWSVTHAQLPIIDVMEENCWRIYFATRNEHNQSHICFLEVASGDPQRILYVRDEPLLPLGGPGTFDEIGLMPVSIVRLDHLVFCYYAGWSPGKTIPYHTALGLAVSHDGGRSFAKYSTGPLLDKSVHDPFLVGTAHILKQDDVWRMWYQSGTKWEVVQGIAEPWYHIKYAESSDGIHWDRRGTVAIDFKDADEAGICSASVLEQNGVFKMWYCYRGACGYRSNPNASYRIGYAESANGLDWQRLDEQAGIAASECGWDALMVCYPCVFNDANLTYMLYNGNGFGETGFGYAVLDSKE